MLNSEIIFGDIYINSTNIIIDQEAKISASSTISQQNKGSSEISLFNFISGCGASGSSHALFGYNSNTDNIDCEEIESNPPYDNPFNPI